MKLAVLIGDVVGSRRHQSRRRLQDELDAALERVNEELSPAQPIRTTVGDEFQGAFEDLEDALLASLLIRLDLLSGAAEVDTRYGLARGRTDVFDAGRPTPSQDGEAWWAARDAIGRAKQLQQQARTKFVSTCFGESTSQPADVTTNDFLTLRDVVVWNMSSRQRGLALHMTRGASLNEAASREGISASGAFQALERSGGFALLETARGRTGRRTL